MQQPLKPPTNPISSSTASPASSMEPGSIPRQPRKLPKAQDLVSYYESQGMDSKEASLKVIDDLQQALIRGVASANNNRGGNRTGNSATDPSRKLDVINARLVRIDAKLDSKPGYAETLGIGVASGAALRGLSGVFPQVLRAVGDVWNAVRSTSSSRNGS